MCELSLSSFSEILGLIAALYFTVATENILLRKLWNIDFERLCTIVLNIVSSHYNEILAKWIRQSINRLEQAFILRIRRIGLFCLIYLFFLLFCAGLESCLENEASIAWLRICVDFLFVVFFCGVLIVFFCSYRLRLICGSTVLMLLIFVITSLVPSLKEWDFLLDAYPYVVISNIAVTILILIVFLSYNFIFVRYYEPKMVHDIKNELNLFNKAKRAIEEKEESMAPSEYDEVYKKIVFRKDTEKKESWVNDLFDILKERLDKIIKQPNVWELLCSYKQQHPIEKEEISIPSIDGLASAVETKDNKTEVSSEVPSMRALCKEYENHPSPKPKLTVFCEKHGISSAEFREEWKEYNKKIFPIV